MGVTVLPGGTNDGQILAKPSLMMRPFLPRQARTVSATTIVSRSAQTQMSLYLWRRSAFVPGSSDRASSTICVRPTMDGSRGPSIGGRLTASASTLRGPSR